MPRAGILYYPWGVLLWAGNHVLSSSTQRREILQYPWGELLWASNLQADTIVSLGGASVGKTCTRVLPLSVVCPELRYYSISTLGFCGPQISRRILQYPWGELLWAKPIPGYLLVNLTRMSPPLQLVCMYRTLVTHTFSRDENIFAIFLDFSSLFHTPCTPPKGMQTISAAATSYCVTR